MERLSLKAKAYQKYIYEGETLFVLGLSLGTLEKSSNTQCLVEINVPVPCNEQTMDCSGLLIIVVNLN